MNAPADLAANMRRTSPGEETANLMQHMDEAQSVPNSYVEGVNTM